MSAWPSALPQRPLGAGFQEIGQGATIRTSMDVGPPKVRQRYTVEITQFSISLLLTFTQVTTLDAFFTSTLGFGTDAFTWSHPRTRAAGSFRFASRPVYNPVGGDLWRADFTMESVP